MVARTKPLLEAAFVLALLFSTTVEANFVKLTTANSGISAPPVLAMPAETLNYTITRVNGTLWAKIDGTYPIHKIFKAGETFELDGVAYTVASDDLPMVYPTPPGTVNIHVKINDTELNWSNYTEAYTYALHHTAIGDWPMIYTTIAQAPEYFTLKIHYEHPITLVNGSSLFLYDLNISPYLTPWSTNSTAYFTIRMETNSSNFRVYTTETDNTWNPMNYTISQDGTTQEITIQIHSEYSKPLLGDLVVAFTDTEAQVPAFPSWIILPILVAVTLFAVLLRRKKDWLRGKRDYF